MSRRERGRKRSVNPGWFRKGYDARRPVPNPGWFRKGFDERRHELTHEERVRGGQACARKFLVIGRWPPGDWWEHCQMRKEEEYDTAKDLYADEQLATRDGVGDIPF